MLRCIFFGWGIARAQDGVCFLAIATIVCVAIEAGSEEIEMGLTTCLPKIHFGAKVTPLFMLARVRGWVPQR